MHSKYCAYSSLHSANVVWSSASPTITLENSTSVLCTLNTIHHDVLSNLSCVAVTCQGRQLMAPQSVSAVCADGEDGGPAARLIQSGQE